MRIRRLRDPLYGYVDYTGRSAHAKGGLSFEEDLIEDPWFQRLHRISQLHCAWIRYPSARHSRFSHSLGVMHLAGEIARAAYEPFHRLQPESNSLPEVEAVVEVFRIAGLLHDIGQGPFGHLFDRVVLERQTPPITHDTISSALAASVFADRIKSLHTSDRANYDCTIDPNLIAYLVDRVPDKQEEEACRARKERETLLRGTPLGKWCLVLAGIITGEFVVDADALDYTSRDAYHCGTPEFRGVDHRRLADACKIVNTHDGPRLMCDRQSVTTLACALMARTYMYEAVYFHEDVRAFEFELEEALSAAARARSLSIDPNGDLSLYQELDESSILTLSPQGSEADCGEVAWMQHQWRRVLAGTTTWKHVVYSHRSMGAAEMMALRRDSIRSAIQNYLNGVVANSGGQTVGSRLRSDVCWRGIKTSLGNALATALEEGDAGHTDAKDIADRVPSSFVLARVYSERQLPKSVQDTLRRQLSTEIQACLKRSRE